MWKRLTNSNSQSRFKKSSSKSSNSLLNNNFKQYDKLLAFSEVIIDNNGKDNIQIIINQQAIKPNNTQEKRKSQDKDIKITQDNNIKKKYKAYSQINEHDLNQKSDNDITINNGSTRDCTFDHIKGFKKKKQSKTMSRISSCNNIKTNNFIHQKIPSSHVVFCDKTNILLSPMALEMNNKEHLEYFINKIKTKGYQRNQKLLIIKSNKKAELNSSINSIFNYVSSRNKEVHTQYMTIGKLQNDTGTYAIRANINQREDQQYIKELNEIKKELYEIEVNEQLTIRETKEINNLIQIEKAEIIKIKENIKEITLNINNITKDKEQISPLLSEMKKMIEAITGKLYDKLSNISSFMIEVSMLSNQKELFNNQ